MATREEILEIFPGELGAALAAEEADDGSEAVEAVEAVEEVKTEDVPGTVENVKAEDVKAEEVVAEPAEPVSESAEPVSESGSTGQEKLAGIISELADKVSEIGKPGSDPKAEEEKVEEVKGFLEELGISLLDFDSAEVQKILDDDMLSPEHKKLFKDQQEQTKKVFEIIGSKFKDLSGDVNDMKIAQTNRSFWGAVESDNSDYAEYVKPEGSLLEGISLTKKTTEWLKSQPEFVQVSVKDALENGTATKVNEALSYIKKSLPTEPVADVAKESEGEDKNATLEDKIKNAAKLASGPKSLNDIPGKTVPTSAEKELEDSDDLSAAAERLSGGDPSKLKELLNNVLVA
jgi:hypothetical protein